MALLQAAIRHDSEEALKLVVEGHAANSTQRMSVFLIDIVKCLNIDGQVYQTRTIGYKPFAPSDPFAEGFQTGRRCPASTLGG